MQIKNNEGMVLRILMDFSHQISLKYRAFLIK